MEKSVGGLGSAILLEELDLSETSAHLLLGAGRWDFPSERRANLLCRAQQADPATRCGIHTIAQRPPKRSTHATPFFP